MAEDVAHPELAVEPAEASGELAAAEVLVARSVQTRSPY